MWLCASTISGPAGTEEEAADSADARRRARVNETAFIARVLPFIHNVTLVSKEVSAVIGKTKDPKRRFPN
jgi:hypothetical protein